MAARRSRLRDQRSALRLRPPGTRTDQPDRWTISLFRDCRAPLYAAGEPLLKRAQGAGVVRSDVDLSDVLHMLGGITRMPMSDSAQIERIVQIALDGLRYRPQA